MRYAALVAGAAAVFLGSWSLLHHGVLARDQISDVPTYQRYVVAVRHDELPYRDFKIEYPPGVLPVVLVPSLRMTKDYDQAALTAWFDREMAIAGCLALIGTALCLRALRAGRLRTVVALGIVALSPLLLGSVVLTRFDFWVAALAVLSLAALLWGRPEVGAILLGVAIGTKLWPAVLVPPVFLWVRRTYGRREGWTWAGVCAAIVVAIFLPFTLFSPSGMAHSFDTQLGRPLQVESFASSILIAARHLFGTSTHTHQGAVSMDIAGPGAHAAALVTTIAGGLGLLLVWWLFARGPATAQRLATYCAASIAVFIAFGKVFSPQFMIWLIPFAVLASGPLGAAAQALLVAALLLTQSWFPRHYWPLALHLPATQSFELLARNLVVLALAFVLAWKRPRAQLE